MNWEPSAEEIEQKLIEMVHIWGDIENVVLFRSTDHVFGEEDDYAAKGELAEFHAAHMAVEAAFRVDVV